MAFTGPTEAGAMEIERKPSADQGHGLDRAPRHLAAQRERHGVPLRRLDDDAERLQRRGIRSSRTAQRRACSRDRRRTGTASDRSIPPRRNRRAAARGRAARAAPAPRSSPRSSAAWARAARAACRIITSRSISARAAWSSDTSAIIGSMMRSSRPCAARSSALIWVRNRAGRSSAMRMARQPIAGFSSSLARKKGSTLSPPTSSERNTTGRSPAASRIAL